MPQLINLETQKPEDLPHENIGAALDSGKYDLPKEGETNVLNPDGKLVSIPNAQAYNAINQYGYRFPSSQDVTKFQENKKYGESGENELKAFAAGAARSASFGLSDVGLTQTGLVNPETLEGLKKYNPNATTLGEVTGIAGSLLTLPEGLVAGVGRVAEKITGAATPLVQGAAKFLANPETAPLANKAIEAIGRVGAKALGTAAEGGIYGIGNSISEKALGDPDLNAEKVLANIGFGAAFGGVLGGGFQALKETGLIKAPKFLSEVDKKALDQGDFGTAINTADNIPPEEKSKILSGLTKLKSNANEIRNAAADLDAPVLAGQISDSKAVQKAQSLLLDGPPTYASLRQQQQAREGFDKATNAMQGVLGETQMTKAELGESLQKSLSNKIEKQYAPTQELYSELKKEFKEIRLYEDYSSEAIEALKKDDRLRISPNAPGSKIINDAIESIPKLKTIDDINVYKQTLKDSLSKLAPADERRAAGLVSDKLSSLIDDNVMAAAKDHPFPPPDIGNHPATKSMLDLLEQKKAADAGYSVFRDKINRISEVLGKKSIDGPQSFLNFLEDLTPEKVASKLFAKDNSQFLKFFQREFPEEMNLINQYQKSLIADSSLKNGSLNLRSALKNIEKLPEETKQIMFKPEEASKLKSIDTYISAFPERFNPSETAHASAFREFFEKPIKATSANIRDYGIEKFIKVASEGGDSASRTGAVLEHLDSLINKSSEAIKTGAKQVFKNTEGRAVEPFLGYMAAKMADKRYKDKFENKTKNLTELQNNPQKMMDKLTNATQDMYAHAPLHTQSMMTSMSTAINFLSSKLPTQPNKAPLSPDYQPSKTEISNFERYYHTVENPLSILKSLKQGTLTTQALETMQTVYPKLYDEMKGALMNEVTSHMSKKNSQVPYSTKLSLSLFLGQDLDNSLTPQNMMMNKMAIQNIVAKNQANQNAMLSPMRTTSKGLGNITSSSRLETNMQSNAHRE